MRDTRCRLRRTGSGIHHSNPFYAGDDRVFYQWAELDRIHRRIHAKRVIRARRARYK